VPATADKPAVTQSVPHDKNAYTQGLLIDQDDWIESTGLYGHYSLRIVSRTSGNISKIRNLPAHVFGEGATLWQNQIYVLTWKAGLCFVYDRNTLEFIKHFRYEGEGWGLTNCDQWLYMSDGSHVITVRSPESFNAIRTIKVQNAGNHVSHLNELEWINGEIWANVYQSNQIVIIDPESGCVKRILQLGHLPLAEDQHEQQDVLNGIAFDQDTETVWVTGKNWSRIYQLDL
jgi:glutamine cyclotransferase